MVFELFIRSCAGCTTTRCLLCAVHLPRRAPRMVKSFVLMLDPTSTTWSASCRGALPPPRPSSLPFPLPPLLLRHLVQLVEVRLRLSPAPLLPPPSSHPSPSPLTPTPTPPVTRHPAPLTPTPPLTPPTPHRRSCSRAQARRTPSASRATCPSSSPPRGAPEDGIPTPLLDAILENLLPHAAPRSPPPTSSPGRCPIRPTPHAPHTPHAPRSTRPTPHAPRAPRPTRPTRPTPSRAAGARANPDPSPSPQPAPPSTPHPPQPPPPPPIPNPLPPPPSPPTHLPPPTPPPPPRHLARCPSGVPTTCSSRCRPSSRVASPGSDLPAIESEIQGAAGAPTPTPTPHPHPHPLDP